MPIELPPPPPHINIPAFSYTPPNHSYGTGMVTTSTTAVSASTFAGGYPDVERPRIEDMSETEYRNVLRPICLVWGFNDVQVVDSSLQLEKPKCATRDSFQPCLEQVSQPKRATTSTTW
jgi:hypothetical protein